MEMNTTKLIAHWSMAGAGDLDGCFGRTAEIHARVEPDEPSSPSAGAVLLKRADEAEWRPLSLGGDPA